MTITEALVSGAVQGFTEFLPVSSSGHLVLMRSLLGLPETGVLFDIWLHVATLAAVVFYFAKDIAALVREKNTKWLFCIIIATIPAVVAALFFSEEILKVRSSVRAVAFMLLVTAFMLFAGQVVLWMRKRGGSSPAFTSSFIVGIAQAFALIPGISRSGATISAGLASGMDAKTAFNFSFLMAIPAIIGATVYETLKLGSESALAGNFAAYASGMLCAFAAGLVSLRFLWRVMSGKKLFVFGIYCFLVGTGVILLGK